jgi:competence protein ComEC
MDTNTKNGLKLLILPLVLATALVHYYAYQVQPDNLMRVDFLSVGQGDATLITTFQGTQVLVDGGPGSAVLQELGEELPLLDRTLEMVVLTHPHLDHFEGLIHVLNHYRVRKVLMPNVDYSSPPYDAFEAAAKAEGAEIIYAVQGQRIWLDQATVLDVMYPTFKDPFRPPKNFDLNDTSIVAKLIFGKTKILFTGDAGIDVEHELLPMFDLDADILKVGHHGSKHSSSEQFLSEVTPEFSVIEVGENKYGHPAPEVMQRLSEIKSQVFRTDQANLEFISDGSSLRRVD